MQTFINFWRISYSFISSTYTQSSIVHDVQKENKINYFARMVKLTITKTLSKRNILYPCMFVSRKWKHCCYCTYCVTFLDVFILKRRIDVGYAYYCSNTLFVWVTNPTKTQDTSYHSYKQNILLTFVNLIEDQELVIALFKSLCFKLPWNTVCKFVWNMCQVHLKTPHIKCRNSSRIEQP